MRKHCSGLGGIEVKPGDLSRVGSRGRRLGRSDQPRLISVPIRSAGQTRLIGALVSASLDGFLPSGSATMWWLKCASTPAI